MVAFLAKLAIFGPIVTIAIALAMPRPVFVIVVAGDSVIRKGKVSRAFANDCERLCRENDIPRASIKGFRDRGRIKLKFCRRVPGSVRQKFRNAWTAYA